MIITDGSLPSNVGGGANVRNIIRRVFAILKKNDWWGTLTMDGFLKIFEYHKQDLKGIYPEFQDAKEYKSLNEVIKLEYERWLKTDTSQK